MFMGNQPYPLTGPDSVLIIACDIDALLPEMSIAAVELKAKKRLPEYVRQCYKDIPQSSFDSGKRKSC